MSYLCLKKIKNCLSGKSILNSIIGWNVCYDMTLRKRQTRSPVVLEGVALSSRIQPFKPRSLGLSLWRMSPQRLQKEPPVSMVRRIAPPGRSPNGEESGGQGSHQEDFYESVNEGQVNLCLWDYKLLVVTSRPKWSRLSSEDFGPEAVRTARWLSFSAGAIICSVTSPYPSSRDSSQNVQKHWGISMAAAIRSQDWNGMTAIFCLFLSSLP